MKRLQQLSRLLLTLLGITILLGCSATDPLVGDVYLQGDFNPSSNNTYNIGSDSSAWSEGWFNDIYIDGEDVSVLKEELITGSQYYASIDGYSGTYTVAANTIYAIPLIVTRDITIDRIAMHCWALNAAGRVMRLGIYANGDNLYPRELILDAGVINCSVTGVLPITIDQFLPKGYYWLVAVGNNTPQFRAVREGNNVLGFDPSSFATQSMMWSAILAYGALPAVFPAGGSTVEQYALIIAIRPSAMN